MSISSFAITGLGLVSAAGADVPSTIKNLFSVAPDSVLQTSTERLPFFEVFSQSSNKMIPKANHLSLQAAEEAFKSAGLAANDLKKMRVGVCMGSTVGGSDFNTEFSSAYNLNQFPDPQLLLLHFKNNISQFISRHYGLTGPVLMLSNACTSGADAIGTGASWLEADLCDVVICGGAEAILPQIYYGFKSMQLCSSTDCKPFDKNRQGLILGEGAGFFILEKKSTPRTIKAYLHGYGTASDAYHPTAPQPEARGLHDAFKQIASVQNKKVDFINAHGTATHHNDLAEGRWLQKYFSESHIVATKAYTGHTLAAAGGIEAVLTVLSLMEQKLPRSKGFTEIDPEIGLTPTTQILSGSYKNALSVSLGFGGTNSILHLGCAE